jgi:uncharacterized peroxidase-related enzyme
MALIKMFDKDNATGRVAEIYESMYSTMGFIPNAFKVYSSSEHILESQYKNLGYFMRHQTLSGKLLAFIRLLVSEQESCAYCIGVNTGILFQYGVLPEAVEEIRLEPSRAPLEPKEAAMLHFVLKMVKDSGSISENDVNNLRNLGWTDRDILDASYHGATQVAADKIFNAFKIELDF